ncbi:LGFP repeat-containing protein [Nocardia sp. alder85J]|uniref:LGFP repeat-containing protein n=1 Tax=Nocardia sp. alder85J TaxID=2862949 RepID=UPI001CD1F5BE|nr:hypothetical protein [Nocardia sp. alder85J]MCX4092687.1 hypothetical protein [Nocardia sp. alder85J]
MSSLSRKALSGLAAGVLSVGVLGGTALAGPGLPEPGPSPEATGAITSHYNDLGGAGSALGPADGQANQIGDSGAVQNYRGGAIFYSPGTGARAVYGDILGRYRDLGGPTGDLGFPVADETDAGDGAGRVENFAEAGGAAIYWSPTTGAHLVRDKVLDAYRASGAVTGPFGYPTTDMTAESGVEANGFAGPTGTEIRWSQPDGLSTVPANLAASLGAQPPAGAPQAAPPIAATGTSSSGINRWWGVPIGLAIAAVVGGLLGLLGRRPAPRPVEPPLRTATAPTVRTAPPARSAFETPRAPRPPREAPRPGFEQRGPGFEQRGPGFAQRRTEFDTPRTGFEMPRTGPIPAGQAMRGPAVPVHGEAPPSPQTRRGAVEPVVHQRPDAEAGGIEVVYENNAVGANQRSHTDKSDPHGGDTRQV